MVHDIKGLNANQNISYNCLNDDKYLATLLHHYSKTYDILLCTLLFIDWKCNLVKEGLLCKLIAFEIKN